jgi:hypothetical protein
MQRAMPSTSFSLATRKALHKVRDSKIRLSGAGGSMKRVIPVLLILVAIAVAVSLAWSYLVGSFPGTGVDVLTEQRALPQFNRIVIDGFADVTLVQGGAESASVGAASRPRQRRCARHGQRRGPRRAPGGKDARDRALRCRERRILRQSGGNAADQRRRAREATRRRDNVAGNRLRHIRFPALRAIEKHPDEEVFAELLESMRDPALDE